MIDKEKYDKISDYVVKSDFRMFCMFGLTIMFFAKQNK